MYRPQPNGVHNTAWWPDVKDSFEEFVRSHPRNPLPDTLSWESSGLPIDSRAGWLIIDKLAPSDGNDAPLPDLNRIGSRGLLMFENSQASGRVDLVRAGNTVKATTRGVAEFTLLLSPDVFDFSRPVQGRNQRPGGVRGHGTAERRDARQVGGARQRPHDALRRGNPRKGRT